MPKFISPTLFIMSTWISNENLKYKLSKYKLFTHPPKTSLPNFTIVLNGNYSSRFLGQKAIVLIPHFLYNPCEIEKDALPALFPK